MRNLPSVNVIIPVLNGGHIIGKCLQAVLTQSYEGQILPVVINDGSADNTSAVARAFDKVKVIDQENMGRASARNRGISESSGEVIAFTDADCVPRSDWLENLVGCMLQTDSCGIVGGAMTIPKSANLWQRLDNQCWAHSTGPDSPAGPTLFGSTANMCLFRSVYESVGGFDERLLGSEDSDLAFRVHSAGYVNYFEPAAVVEHDHPRTTMAAFFRQRYNYGKWTIQTVLKHRPLPPYSWMFPDNRLLLALLWPLYAILSTGFTVSRVWRKDLSVLWLMPLLFLGRVIEYYGTIWGCAEYQRKIKRCLADQL